MMVMKRSSDAETHVKSKRGRSRADLDDNGVRERFSSPESARDSGSPVQRRTTSLPRKHSDERTYKRSAISNMRNDNNYQIQQRRVDRDPEPQIRLSNLANHIGDQPMKESIFHEFKKFGDISVHLFGRGNDRYAVLYFRSLDDAKETKRALERRSRTILFDRPLRIEYNLYPERTSNHSPGDYYHRSASPVRWKQRASNPPPFEFDRGRGDYDRRNRGGGNFTPPQQEYIPPEEDPKATRTLFVGNLETGISCQDLRLSFEKFGVVLDVDIKRPARGQGNTYAFVKFADLDVAAKAKCAMQGQCIGRNHIKIGYGRSQQTTRLWVGGLGPWISIPELEREFDRFGAIRRIDYRKGGDHAYILYDSLDAASVAAREMRGFQMGDRRLRIDFADKEQGMKDYDPSFYGGRRGVSPSRARSNDVDRINDLYSPPQDGDFRDDRAFVDPKDDNLRDFRRERREGSNSFNRNWRNDDGYQSGNYDRPENNTPQRSFPDDWDRQDRKGPGVDSNDWDRRSLDKMSRGPQYRRRGPQTPPLEDFAQFERSPSKGMDDEGPRKRRGQYRKRDHQNEENNTKPPKTSRTSSPSPDNPNRSRRTSPNARRHSGSSSDSHFSRSHTGSNAGLNENDQGKNSEEQTLDKKPTKDKKESDARTKEQTPSKENPNPMPPGTENLQDLAKRFAVAWKGSLILKNSAFPVRMHLVGGNPEIADSLIRNDGSTKSSLRITQRLRLDQPKLEEVSRRINTAGASGHCLLLALPGTQIQLPESTEELQHRPLRNLMTYLKQKQAAGVVNLPVSPSNSTNAKDDVGVLHAFPPCQFSHEHLLRIAPHLSAEPSKEDHLVIVVVRGAA
ncbi:RNA-binding protein 15 [Nematostella vectensis]|uniref:RNA-binding protein 15 n=1 Tax=Nematostella vectensis TaxID=45351 RepID=UPI00138FCB4E|nr:RNA-binding protein 15 [Nematostella vectensis]